MAESNLKTPSEIAVLAELKSLLSQSKKDLKKLIRLEIQKQEIDNQTLR